MLTIQRTRHRLTADRPARQRRRSHSALLAVGAAMAVLPAGSAIAAENPASTAGAAGAVNRLGANLQLEMVESAGGTEDNLVFSPFSVAVALAMTSAGAGSETLAEMNDVLGLEMADPHPAMGDLVDAVVAAGDEGLAVANSMWTQRGFAIEHEFADTVEREYGAAPYEVDFAGDPAACTAEINEWVDDATAGRIPELLGPDVLSIDTRLVLVNAIHLDAEWQRPFSSEATRPGEFTTATGSAVEVDFMNRTANLSYGEVATDAGDLQAVRLPYTNGYEMVVVLPPEGELAEWEAELAERDGDLDAAVGSWETTEVILSLPKWDIDTPASLADPLQTLGMPLAFDPDLADFSGISSEDELFISDVVHQANITVDEDGTEAAAATAVIGDVASAPIDEPDPVVMRVDQPFFFVVRDADSGTVLFQGRITDPS